jgi:uncharacterized protein (DUF2267 family)
MSLHFYAYARKGYEFIDDIASALKTSDTDKAGRLTRCVLRALRNQLSLDDSFRFIAQLPMALKAVYVDGWKFSSPGEKTTANTDFIAEVVKEDANSAWRDFSKKSEVKDVVLAVFKVISKHIGVGEMEQVIKMLPSDLQHLLHEEIHL